MFYRKAKQRKRPLGQQRSQWKNPGQRFMTLKNTNLQTAYGSLFVFVTQRSGTHPHAARHAEVSFRLTLHRQTPRRSQGEIRSFLIRTTCG